MHGPGRRPSRPSLTLGHLRVTETDRSENMTPIYLKESDVTEFLDMPTCVQALRDAFAAEAKGAGQHRAAHALAVRQRAAQRHGRRRARVEALRGEVLRRRRVPRAVLRGGQGPAGHHRGQHARPDPHRRRERGRDREDGAAGRRQGRADRHRPAGAHAGAGAEGGGHAQRACGCGARSRQARSLLRAARQGSSARRCARRHRRRRRWRAPTSSSPPPTPPSPC